MVNIKDKSDKKFKYKVFSMRLSDQVITELKRRRKKTWNLLLKELLKINEPNSLKNMIEKSF